MRIGTDWRINLCITFDDVVVKSALDYATKFVGLAATFVRVGETL